VDLPGCTPSAHTSQASPRNGYPRARPRPLGVLHKVRERHLHQTSPTGRTFAFTVRNCAAAVSGSRCEHCGCRQPAEALVAGCLQLLSPRGGERSDEDDRPCRILELGCGFDIQGERFFSRSCARLRSFLMNIPSGARLLRERTGRCSIALMMRRSVGCFGWGGRVVSGWFGYRAQVGVVGL
jgi:hypothetical protein